LIENSRANVTCELNSSSEYFLIERKQKHFAYAFFRRCYHFETGNPIIFFIKYIVLETQARILTTSKQDA